MTTSTLDPIAVTCNRCGTGWETRSQRNAKCPQCGTTRRVHRQKAGVRPESQVRALRVVPARQAARKAPQRTSAPAPVMQYHGIDPADLQYLPGTDWESEAEAYNDDEDYRDTEAEAQARQAQLMMVVRNIQVNSRVHPGPAGAIEPVKLPRVLVQSEGRLIGAVTAIASGRGRRKEKVQRCEFCGARPGISTSNLYRVRSPALIGERTLCDMHMKSEAVIPGCVAETL